MVYKIIINEQKYAPFPQQLQAIYLLLFANIIVCMGLEKGMGVRGPDQTPL